MKEYIIVAVLAAFVLSTETGCVAQDKKVNGTSPGMVSSERKLLSAKKRTPPTEPLVTVKATVKDVDLAKRLLTLKDFAGKVFDLKVGEEVENLGHLKIGDEVVARYYEWAAVEINKAKGAMTSATAATAEPGEEPAGVVRDRITVTAKVEEIDHPRTHVTISQPDGGSVKVFVRRPSYLKDVTAGDLVSITYSEALAISVEKTKQK